jgi:hypothetical protein
VSRGQLGQEVRCPLCGQAFQTKAPVRRSSSSRKARSVKRHKESWFVLKNDRQVGPFPMEMLKRMALGGHLTADMWVIMAGTDACILASSIPGLEFRPRRRTRPKARKAPTTTANPATTPAPRQATPRPAAPVATEIVTVDCPACRSKCSIPRPQTATTFNCPRCKLPFRAASTSVGIVVKRMQPPPASARNEKG